MKNGRRFEIVGGIAAKSYTEGSRIMKIILESCDPDDILGYATLALEGEGMVLVEQDKHYSKIDQYVNGQLVAHHTFAVTGVDSEYKCEFTVDIAADVLSAAMDSMVAQIAIGTIRQYP